MSSPGQSKRLLVEKFRSIKPNYRNFGQMVHVLTVYLIVKQPVSFSHLRIIIIHIMWLAKVVVIFPKKNFLENLICGSHLNINFKSKSSFKNSIQACQNTI